MIVRADLVLLIKERIKWRAWKGVFAGKVVYDAFKTSGVDPDFSFRVAPPRKFRPDIAPGDQVEFSVFFWGRGSEDAVNVLLDGLNKLNHVSPIYASVEEVEAKPLPVSDDSEPVAVFFAVEHEPTFYRFHGAWVPFPSPQRLIYSLFRRLSEATGTELKGLAGELAPKIEAVGGRPKFGRYKVKFDEEVPAFSGVIKYFGIMERRLAEALKWALEYLPYLGAGSSPGLGFGHVVKVSVENPPFETPAPGWTSKKEVLSSVRRPRIPQMP